MCFLHCKSREGFWSGFPGFFSHRHPPSSRGAVFLGFACGMPFGDCVEKNRMIGGVIVLFMGVMFLLMNYGILPYDFWKLWPFIPIIIGAGMLLGDKEEKK